MQRRQQRHQRHPAAMLPVFLLLVTRIASAAGDDARIPVRFTLEKPGFVTVVVEDAGGKRVANLLANARMPAGEHTLHWNGYGTGLRAAHGRVGDVPVLHRRVAPGTYTVRGLVHQGLKLKYEMSVYTAGDPPWHTEDGSGAWLADHGCPSGVLYLPASLKVSCFNGADGMLLYAVGAECGHGFAFTDLNGRKLYGGRRFRSMALARDLGPNPNRDYVAFGSNGLTLSGLTKDGVPEELLQYTSTANHPNTISVYRKAGLAVYSGVAVIADGNEQVLRVVDLGEREHLGQIEYTGVRDVEFDAEGRLYVLTNGAVTRYRFDAEHVALTEPRAVVSSGLSDAQQMLLHGNRIFVTDWGQDHQVKIFSIADGRYQRAIGTPGGMKLGPYDPTRLFRPYGLEIDGDGVLWVCEFGQAPKRVSRWSLDGKLLSSMLGPSKYGGGGMIDPKDKTRFYLSNSTPEGNVGLEFKLDWQNGVSELAGIYYKGPVVHEEWTKLGWEAYHRANYEEYDRRFCPFDLFDDDAPERAVYHEGRQHMVKDFNGWGRRAVFGDIFLMQDDGTIRPVATVLGAGDFMKYSHSRMRHVRDADKILDFLAEKMGVVRKPDSNIPGDAFQRHIVGWSDLNFDGYVQTDELQVARVPGRPDNEHWGKEGGGAYYVHDNMDITTKFAGYLELQETTTDGVPVYDFSKIRWLTNMTEIDVPQYRYHFGDRGPILHGPDDWIVIQANLGLRGYRGDWKWDLPTHPNNMLPQTGGIMPNANRFVGPVMRPAEGDAGPLFGINGDMGQIWAITTDGLFIDDLGADCRVRPILKSKGVRRGTVIENISFNSEHFGPTLNQTADGTIYLVAGKEHISIWEVLGLDAVRRIEFDSLELKAGRLAGLAAEHTVRPAEKSASNYNSRGVMYCYYSRKMQPEIDGDLTDWNRIPQRAWTAIDPQAKAAWLFSDKKLYAAFRLNNGETIRNSGRDFRYCFKTGGGLDIMLGTDQGDLYSDRNRAYPDVKVYEPTPKDLRIFVTRVGDRFRAVLFRQKAETEENAHRFESPIGEVRFDQIVDISSQVEAAQQGNIVEVAIPLSVIGLEAKSYMKLMGDVGVVRGDGTENTQRVYWHNKNTTIVRDEPSEARLEPRNWGIVFVKRLPEDPSDDDPLDPQVLAALNAKTYATPPAALWQHAEFGIDLFDQPWEHADGLNLRFRYFIDNFPAAGPFSVYFDNLRVTGTLRSGEPIVLFEADAEDDAMPFLVPEDSMGRFKVMDSKRSPPATHERMNFGGKVYAETKDLQRGRNAWLWHFDRGNMIIELPDDLDRRRPLRVSFDAAVERMTRKFKAQLEFYPTFYEQEEKLGSRKMIEIRWANE